MPPAYSVMKRLVREPKIWLFTNTLNSNFSNAKSAERLPLMTFGVYSFIIFFPKKPTNRGKSGRLLSAFAWLICVVETPHFNMDPASYSVFSVVFEVISAYGCVGISVGHPNYTTSLSGALRGGSQLLLCAVMLLGRTREARKGVMKGDWGIGATFPGMEEEEAIDQY